MTALWCMYLGDEAEHIAHVDVCDKDAALHWYAVNPAGPYRNRCTKCNRAMKLIKIVWSGAGPEPELKPWEMDVQKGLDRLNAWIADHNRRADEQAD